MKKILSLALSLALALSLFGCARQEPAKTDNTPQAAAQQSTPVPANEPASASEPAAEEWSFAIKTETTAKEYKADDGTVIARSSYEQPMLVLVNASGEVFSGSSPERGVTAEQLAALKTFNDATASTDLWDVDLEEQGKEIYEFHKDNGDEMPPVEDDVTLSEANQQGGLLSVLMNGYINLGGAHPDNGLWAWSFDLNTGKFVGLEALTDRPEDMKQVIIGTVASKISTSEALEGYYENWYELLQEQDSFDVYFGSDGILVFFQEYVLGPHVLGVPAFTIPYGTVSRLLNAYGEQLLGLPVEARVIGDFHEAQELWSWLDAGAPTDYTDSRIEGDVYYCRVDSPDVHTLADVSKMLSRYVDNSFVDAQLSQSDVLREFDGVLYAASVGRGDDLTIASVDFDAVMDVGNESGKVIVTIHRQDFDDASGTWVLTGNDDTCEFPFTLRDGHAVFSTMEYIY